MIEERPWGNYEIIREDEKSKVKRITVHPGQRLSLQTHEKRSEYWVIVQGTGLVRLEEKEALCVAGDAFAIEEETAHRIANTGEDDLVFIEVQLGTYFGEDDIIRLEDDYGR